ncbi:5-oxoprolinase subunit PxpB [Actinomadura macrotermitis]|uniref:Carboxyltransferase domain-containing protein n=1 Tax=Actinomadura macrotermitis TaxID=2585200 RepID=A0A7K0C4I1_9ACTN|nr:5-oxoprolinase subunit PxpB [Actinomadura macrotermitis]MQY08353.1 putative protein YbgJ [Actinomadura macrotermitis]
MRIRRAGDRGLLVETGDPHRLHAAVRAAGLPGVLDVVPGERTVLITTAGDPGRLAERLPGLPLPEQAAGDAPPVQIPVVYDGADLAEVAELTGLSPEEVVARHTAAEYTVAYLGFSPGFGYLTGLPAELRVPRRDSPRTAVPAGAVAIAGPYAAVYPAPSPGGWRLLGRTDLALWDVTRDPPSLLRPGARVRFVADAS